MATYFWNSLPTGGTYTIDPFDPNADTLVIDDPLLSAAKLHITYTSAAPFSVTLSDGVRTITLAMDVRAVTTGNITFVDGSQFIVGDNTTGTVDDDGPNVITGTSHDDQIIALGGNDTIDSGGGNDLIFGGPGNKTMDGNAGVDTLAFSDESGVVWANFSGVTQSFIVSTIGGPVTVNLGAGKVQHGMFDIVTGAVPFEDTVSNVENLVGGIGNDFVWGGDLIANLIRGGFGNDVLHGGTPSDTSSDSLFGEGGNDLLRPGQGSDLVDGGPGTDTMDFSSTGFTYGGATAVSVDLFAHQANIGNGFFDTTVLDIEAVIGTAGNDFFQAGDPLHGPNAQGVSIAELFQPRAGSDFVLGESDFGRQAIVDYSPNTGAQAIRANLGPSTFTANGVTVFGNTVRDGIFVSGSEGNDLVFFVQNVRGGAGNDTIFGGGPTRAPQGGFFEIYRGNGGDDYIDGLGASPLPNPTRDSWATRADYQNSVNPVTVNFGAAPLVLGAFTLNSGEAFDGIGGANGGNGGRDRLVNISQVFGGSGNDVVVGGFDELVVNGGAGNDTIDSTVGIGEVRFSTATNPVIVNFTSSAVTAGGFTVAANTAHDGQGGTDTLIGVEGARGGDGDDFLFGGNGDEFFSGGIGNDTVDGGGGLDIIRYTDVPFVLGGITITLDNGNAVVADGYGTTDTLTNIEGAYGTHNNDTLNGELGVQHFWGRGGSDDIDGGPDSDWIHYNTDPSAVTIDLPHGRAIDGWGPVFGFAGLDTLFEVENAEGSVFGDTIIGNGTVNTLLGNAGDDTIEGRGSDDTLDGGEGNDRLEGGPGADALIGDNGFDYVKYRYAASGVFADLSGILPGTGDAAGDTFSSIEGAIGSNFNDTLFGDGNRNDLVGLDGQDGLAGGGGNDNLQGFAGDDLLDGGPGGDVLKGGDGFDLASYQNAGGVTANLSRPGNNTGEAAGDFYVSIEGFLGSNLPDTLVGDARANLLAGLSGDDTIEGRGGADMLQGGDGSDRLEGGAGGDSLDGGVDLFLDYAKYRYAPTAVVADLAGINVNFGDADGDTYTNIDGLIGSIFGDLLYGNDFANDLAGHDGDDDLSGRGGADNLQGGNGNDTLDAGANDPVGPRHDRLVGGAGDDNFDFHIGEADGDEVFDFQGILAVGADKLRFFGYGPNPTFAFVDPTHYSITPDTTVGGPTEVITFTNAAIVVPATDVQFFP